MKMDVFTDVHSVARQAAALIAAEARSAVGERGCFIFAVSGGHTPWIMLPDGRGYGSAAPLKRQTRHRLFKVCGPHRGRFSCLDWSRRT